MDFIPTLVTKIKSRKYIFFVGDISTSMISPKSKLNVLSMNHLEPFFLILKKLIVR